jgi:hypothetical protein
VIGAAFAELRPAGAVVGTGFPQAGIAEYSNHGIPLKKLLD